MKSAWWKSKEDLVDEQLDILAIQADESFLITGPAGSGKTNLLLLRANVASMSPRSNIRIVVLTKLLRRFIETGGPQYKFDPAKIRTHFQLFAEIMRELDLPHPSTEDYEKKRKELLSEIRSAITAKKIGKMYDTLFLDEAQDFYPDEIEVFSSLTDVIVAAADFRQKIYPTPNCEAALKSVCTTEYPLTHHFRNGEKICRAADFLMRSLPQYEPMLPTMNYDETSFPSSIELWQSPDASEMYATLITRLQAQLGAYPDELLGVLVPTNDSLEDVWAALESSALSTRISLNKGAAFSPERPIWTSTMSAAKGLEFRCVHLVHAELLSKFGSLRRTNAYMATTSAKTVLEVYYLDKLWPQYQSALAQAAGNSGDFTIDNAFGN